MADKDVDVFLSSSLEDGSIPVFIGLDDLWSEIERSWVIMMLNNIYAFNLMREKSLESKGISNA